MQTAPIRVLLIEDDEDDFILVRELLSEIRDGPGYHLDWVPTYAAGLAAVRARNHDVYLLDHHLGAHLGLELLHEVGDCPAPIILLTGYGDRETDLAAMRSGAADFLTKSGLTARHLERSIRYALEGKRGQDALRAARDASEKACQEILEANRLKARFLATMSHEFRTPLHSILGFSELLMDESTDPMEVREFARCIHESGKHLLNLVKSLLDLSKIESGRLDLDLVTFDLSMAIQSACESVAPLARARGQHLEWPDQPLGEFRADPGRFHQILLNLLSNAVKFTPPGGSVWVEVSRDPQGIHLAVHDTGIGIAPQDQTRIFEPYVRVRLIEQEGTGLGLPIVRLLVEAHGGHIEVSSEQGKGSCFSVSLPDPGAPPEPRASR